MATLIWKNGQSYDADTVIQQFLNSKGKNPQERAALLAEYNYANDMSSWVEFIINKHGFIVDGGAVEKVSQR